MDVQLIALTAKQRQRLVQLLSDYGTTPADMRLLETLDDRKYFLRAMYKPNS